MGFGFGLTGLGAAGGGRSVRRAGRARPPRGWKPCAPARPAHRGSPGPAARSRVAQREPEAPRGGSGTAVGVARPAFPRHLRPGPRPAFGPPPPQRARREVHGVLARRRHLGRFSCLAQSREERGVAYWCCSINNSNACVAASCTTFGAPPRATPAVTCGRTPSAKRGVATGPVANAVAQRHAAAATTLRKFAQLVRHELADALAENASTGPAASSVSVSSPSFVKAFRPSTRSSHSSDLSSCCTFWRWLHFLFVSAPNCMSYSLYT